MNTDDYTGFDALKDSVKVLWMFAWRAVIAVVVILIVVYVFIPDVLSYIGKHLRL